MRRHLGFFTALLALALACGQPAWAVSGLMVRCDVAGAQVYLNDQSLGTCPGKFTPEPGSYTLRIHQGIDADNEWVHSRNIVLTEGDITKIEATLTKQHTPAYAQREAERKAAQQQALKAQYEQEQPARAQRAEKLSGEFVTIKGGCFQMGDVFGDGRDNEKPVHKVCVKGFKLAKYEVTQWQWRQAMGSNPSRFKYCGDDCPVEEVYFNDVQAFIAKLNEQTGQRYRLPTEAEWEYACGSGGKDQRYCGGDNLDVLAWYNANSGRKTHPVGGKKANGLGLYDMSGNVWEWTCSQYEKKYAGAEKKCDTNNDDYAGRVLRGGAWYLNAGLARVSYRYWTNPVYPIDAVGLRLAQDL